jgi:murein DD-endopeptidase MepM/ murein hydrolase activator NlpD
MITGLLLLALVLLALMAIVMVSYASLLKEARQVRQLQERLAEANRELAGVRDLEGELSQMRSLQERLLVMLGVEREADAGQDTLAWSASQTDQQPVRSLEQVANLVITPPPDLWPVAGFVTAEFIQGDTQRGVRPHWGIDLVDAQDAPVKAAGKGQVTSAGWDDYLGNFVEIQHGFGYVTVYGHCSRLEVRRGDRVERGQVIGYLGGTGQASAPHLHFEVWKDGEAMDPRAVIPGEPRH